MADHTYQLFVDNIISVNCMVVSEATTIQQNIDVLPQLQLAVKEFELNKKPYHVSLTIINDYLVYFLKDNDPSGDLMLFLHHNFAIENATHDLLKTYRKEIIELFQIIKKTYKGIPYDSIRFNLLSEAA